MVNRVLQVKIFKMRRRGKHKTHSQARVKQTVDKERMQYYYNDPHTYESPPPEVIYGIKDAYHPRIAALLKRKELLSGVDPKVGVTLIDDQSRVVKMFFTTKLDCFTFYEVNKLYGFVQESISYSSRGRADDVWRKQTIKWKQPQYLSVTPPVTA